MKNLIVRSWILSMLLSLCLVSCSYGDKPTASDVLVSSNDISETISESISSEEEVVPFADHYFLNAKGKGGCRTLTGDVVATIVFVDDPYGTWNDDAIAAEKEKLEQAADFVEEQAASYGVTLSLSLTYKTGETDWKIENGVTEFHKEVLKSTDLPSFMFTNKKLADIYACDQAPIFYYLNYSGRSMAYPNRQGEFAVLYVEDEDIAFFHEMAHIFGAVDFYFPEWVKELSEEMFPDSQMLYSENDNGLDPVNAYLVGWTEEPNEQAIAFLNQTASITKQEWEDAYNSQMYTGHQEDYPFSGGFYTGQLKDGLPHGEGVWKNGAGVVAEGTFVYGSLEGKGTYTFADGTHYEGEFKNGSFDGTGVIHYQNGDYYEGEFRDGVNHGKGVYSFANGNRYEGEFQDDLFHGEGFLSFENGAWYEGEFQDNAFHGYGVLCYTDGTRYEGEFRKGFAHGKGTILYADGGRFEGEFVEDNRHGYGVHTWANGETLSGYWENDEYIGE